MAARKNNFGKSRHDREDNNRIIEHLVCEEPENMGEQVHIIINRCGHLQQPSQRVAGGYETKVEYKQASKQTRGSEPYNLETSPNR